MKELIWTQFWDMHSGGDIKEEYQYIYIESESEEQAKIIFYNRFGHSPNRVSCTCCGEDYAIESHKDIKQLTGYHRGCLSLSVPRDKNGLYMNDLPEIQNGLYVENGEEPPAGFVISKISMDLKQYQKYQTLEEYKKNDNVLFIYFSDVKDEEKYGEVPKQGYVWVD